jgi:hypothetical protein
MEVALTLLTVIATLEVGILSAKVAQPHLLDYLVVIQAQAHQLHAPLGLHRSAYEPVWDSVRFLRHV